MVEKESVPANGTENTAAQGEGRWAQRCLGGARDRGTGGGAPGAGGKQNAGQISPVDSVFGGGGVAAWRPKLQCTARVTSSWKINHFEKN